MAGWALQSTRVSSMTLTARHVGDEQFDADLARAIDAVPLAVVDGEHLLLPKNRDMTIKKHTRRATVDQIPTGARWRSVPVTACVRSQPHRGRRGLGEATLSNFRNCITFRAGNRVAKVFRAGAVQACGFKSIDEFHDTMETVLPVIGPAGQIDESATRVHLVVADATLILDKPLHLRSFARLCAARVRGDELVDFNPDEFSGVKVKLERPGESQREQQGLDGRVSLVVRAKGNVKLFLGRPGSDVQGEIDALWERVRELIGAPCDRIDP